jgi:hypothetical protein
MRPVRSMAISLSSLFLAMEICPSIATAMLRALESQRQFTRYARINVRCSLTGAASKPKLRHTNATHLPTRAAVSNHGGRRPCRDRLGGPSVRITCTAIQPLRTFGKTSSHLSHPLVALNQKECTSSPGGPISTTPFASCACAIANGLKVSRSNLISPALRPGTP